MKQPRKLKSDGRYKDAPRYPVIYDYEDEFRSDFKKGLSKGLKDIISTVWKIRKQ